MLKVKILLLFLFISLSVLAQNDTISKKELRKQEKELKKKTVSNDSIQLTNGDILVGEIKKMDKSVLILKTKYSDSDFKIKWHKVKTIKSNRYFIIAMEDGDRFNSSINSINEKDGKNIMDFSIKLCFFVGNS